MPCDVRLSDGRFIDAVQRLINIRHHLQWAVRSLADASALDDSGEYGGQIEEDRKNIGHLIERLRRDEARTRAEHGYEPALAEGGAL